MRLRHVLIAASLASASILVPTGAASAAPTKVGVQTFVITSDINEPGGSVIASGVINDEGVDIVVSETEDIFDFGSNGTITVFHSPLRSHEKFNEKKCTFSFTEKGTYVFGDGTGEWAGYNGSGTYTVKGEAVDACGETPVGTITITAKGPINLSTDEE